MYSPEELGALADVVLGKDLSVISDEIYERLVYGDHRFASFATVRPGLAERTVLVNGVSKSYAMTGWRIGWTLSPAKLAKAMDNLQSQETSNPSSISQYAALAAIDGPQQCVDEMLAEFAKRREFVQAADREHPGVTCPRDERRVLRVHQHQGPSGTQVQRRAGRQFDASGAWNCWSSRTWPR